MKTHAPQELVPFCLQTKAGNHLMWPLEILFALLQVLIPLGSGVTEHMDSSTNGDGTCIGDVSQQSSHP